MAFNSSHGDVEMLDRKNLFYFPGDACSGGEKTYLFDWQELRIILSNRWISEATTYAQIVKRPFILLHARLPFTFLLVTVTFGLHFDINPAFCPLRRPSSTFCGRRYSKSQFQIVVSESPPFLRYLISVAVFVEVSPGECGTGKRDGRPTLSYSLANMGLR